MKVEKTNIHGLLIIEPDIFEDNRGYFFESYNEEKLNEIFKEIGLNEVRFVQDNHIVSKRGVLRGLHFQKKPFEQGKLVRVVKGKVLDVVVDLRKDSETYRQWFSIELSAENKKMLWVPEGFAHGFLSLEDDTIFQYKVTNFYNKNADSGILWNDVEIGINWDFEKYGLKKEEVFISEKDEQLPVLREVEV
jgi:dTDP-4-dehydrorhamnose 3,5-epimerase